MSIDHPGFFDRAGPFTVAELAEAVGAALPEAVEVGAPQRLIADIAPLDQARSDALTFLDNPKYRDQLATTRAAACLMSPEMAERAPDGVIPLLTNQPYHGFARALALMFPTAIMPATLSGEAATAIDPTAVIEDGAIVEPGALIGPEAQIGRGARIAAGAVIGQRCCIGRDSIVGPNAVVVCTLVGDRVVLHAGVRIGQDGFGFAMGPSGHLKVPQVGRVVVQDDVEIGAGTTIDRGALKDTVIGEGTKIDNLVQIGHNVVIGRHCVIVAQVGISGSTELGDFVVMGGHAGAVGHIKIGNGAQIAGASHVKNDVPPGSRMGGTPARSLKQWAREIAALRRLASR